MGWDGFDSVELVMDIEDLFSLAIPDREADRLHTAGDLRDYLVARVGAVGADATTPCETAAAFHRTRRALAHVLGIDVAGLRPGSPLPPLMPRRAEAQRAVWDSVARHLRVPFAKSVDRKAAAVTMGVLAGVAGVLSAVCVLNGGASDIAKVPAGVTLLLLVGGMMAQAIGCWLTADALGPLTVSACQTVGDLSGALYAHSVLGRLSATEGGWTDRDVWAAVQCLTAKSADVAPSRIRPDTRFDRLL